MITGNALKEIRRWYRSSYKECRNFWRRKVILKFHRFDTLNIKQKTFLLSEYRKQEISSYVPYIISRKRWFNNLEKWGYIERQETIFISIDDESSRYEITDEGWNAIESSVKRGNIT